MIKATEYNLEQAHRTTHLICVFFSVFPSKSIHYKGYLPVIHVMSEYNLWTFHYLPPTSGLVGSI